MRSRLRSTGPRCARGHVRGRFRGTIRALRGPSSLVLFALLAAPAAGAQERSAAGGSHRPHVRPMRVTEQLDYCRALVRAGEDATTLEGCFAHGVALLEGGLRQRRKAPPGSPEFDALLARTAKELTRRIGALRYDDAEQLEQQLRALDEAIHELRVELSRMAAAERIELSLVSRGGASLGNWQAGFLFLITEWAKARRQRHAGAAASEPAFSTVTGASAGAVNGFAATIEGCSRPNVAAPRSLYYQVWIDLGLFGRHGAPGLFPTEEDGSTALSLFTDGALEATLDKADVYVRHSALLPSCSVDFGFVATHLDPASTPVHVRVDGEYPVLELDPDYQNLPTDVVDEWVFNLAAGWRFLF
jgi:hypothetical protein